MENCADAALLRSGAAIANQNNLGAAEAGRARHAVRAVVYLAKRGAHGVTHLTS